MSKREKVVVALQRLCALYHRRGIERSHTELKKLIQNIRYKEGMSLDEAIGVLEDDARGLYKPEE